MFLFHKTVFMPLSQNLTILTTAGQKRVFCVFCSSFELFLLPCIFFNLFLKYIAKPFPDPAVWLVFRRSTNVRGGCYQDLHCTSPDLHSASGSPVPVSTWGSASDAILVFLFVPSLELIHHLCHPCTPGHVLLGAGSLTPAAEEGTQLHVLQLGLRG